MKNPVFVFVLITFLILIDFYIFHVIKSMLNGASVGIKAAVTYGYWFLCIASLGAFLLFPFIGNAQESTASKNVSTFTIEAPQLKTSKKIWIYLPEGYSATAKKTSHLKEVLELWKKNQNALENGSDSLAFPKEKSETISKLYLEINPIFNKIKLQIIRKS